jgi:hypothetical protein
VLIIILLRVLNPFLLLKALFLTFSAVIYVIKHRFIYNKGGDVRFKKEKKAKLVLLLLKRLLNC